MRRIEDANLEEPLGDHQHQRDRQHRRRQDEDDAGRVDRPDEERQLEPAHSRHAQRVHRDDEVETGEDRREADDEDARQRQHHVAVGEHRRVRRVKGPARVDSAEEERCQRDHAAGDVEVPAQEVQAREGEVAGADHQRQHEVADHRRDRRDQEQPHHDHAVRGEKLVVGVVGDEVARRRRELEPDQRRRRAADEEERRDGDRVEDGDALVVVRRQPRAQGVAVVKVAHRPPPGGAGVSPVERMYATIASISSSSSWPANDGITGSNPATTSFSGSRTESRT